MAIFNGTGGADTITGTAGDDTINGLGGTDTLDGGGGHDSVFGGLDSDQIVAHAGDDSLYGEGGDDTLFLHSTGRLLADGGDGNDVINIQETTYVRGLQGGNGADTLVLGFGELTIDSFSSANGFELYMGTQNGSIRGTAAANVLDFRGLSDASTHASSGILNAFGGLGDDVIYGLGGDHADHLFGDLGQSFNPGGNDLIYGGGGGDQIEGDGGDDTLHGEAGNDRLYGGQGSDFVYGGDGDDQIWSIYNDGADWLDGGAGDDQVEIGGVVAYLQGGSGVDMLHVGSGIATLEAFSAANGFELWGGGQHQIWGTNSANILDFSSLTAMPGSNRLTIQSNDGDDVLIGVGGSVQSWLFGGGGDDLVIGLAGADRLVGGAGNDVVRGGAANDELIGEGGNDVLSGGQGNDSLSGWDGIDTADYDQASAGVTASLADGVASDDGDDGSDTLSGIENLSGSAFADTLIGDAGDNRLLGRGGVDSLSGGAGIDIADYSSASGSVVVNLASGTASSDGHGSSDTLLDIENLVGSAFSDSLTGDGLANVLEGGAGDDVLDGGGGFDTAAFSDDVHAVAVNGAVVTVMGPGGTDVLTGIERLRFGGVDIAVAALPAMAWIGSTGADAISGGASPESLFGFGGNDVLNGDGGDDLLVGGAGVDVLNGGAGIDTADYSTAAGAMRAQLNANSSTNDGDGGSDTFSSMENLTGSAFNDTLIGDNNVNVLRGGLGSDTLLGLGGNDVLWGGSGALNALQGGLGDDTYVLEAADSVTEFAGEGTDTVDARIAVYTLAVNVENLVFGGAGNFTGTGNVMANVMTGGAGADILRGRGGADTLNGGLGLDTADYTLAAAGVVVRLDLQRATTDGDGATDTYTSIENAIGSNFNDVIYGDGNANLLQGGIGSDVLVGGGGNDVLMGGSGGVNNQLQGGTGDDLYILDAFDTIVELAGQGVDTVQARVGSYTLGANVENLLYTGPGSFVGSGNALDNVLTGGTLDDILRGRGGNDTIDGGLGVDEVQLRGLSADYTVTAEGNGWRVVDATAGRDGSTFVNSIEVLRFADNTTRALSYPPAVLAAEFEAMADPALDLARLFDTDARPDAFHELAPGHRAAHDAFDGWHDWI